MLRSGGVHDVGARRRAEMVLTDGVRDRADRIGERERDGRLASDGRRVDDVIGLLHD